MDRTYLRSESEECNDLCHIPQDYLKYYSEKAEELSEIDNVSFKVMKGSLQIKDNTVISNSSNLISAFESTIGISDSHISKIKCEGSIFNLIMTSMKVYNSNFDLLKGINDSVIFNLPVDSYLQLENVTLI